jgi:hypothetical protein
VSHRQVRRSDEKVRDLITDLMAAATAVSLYGEGHPRARQRMEALHLALTELLDRFDDMLLLAVTGNELFVDGRPFTRLARQSSRLVQRLRHTGVEYVSFKAGVTEEELLALVQALAASQPPPWRRQPHVAVGRLAYALPRGAAGSTEASRPFSGAVPAIRERVALLAEAFDSLASGSALPTEHFDLIARSIVARLADEPNPLLQLAPWQGAEAWLAVHSHNVGVMAAGLSGLAGLPAASCHDMALAGLFHDVGKAFRSIELVERELKLAGDEIELVIDHPRMGLEILLACEGVPEVATVVAYEHHLGFNAAGYPPLRHRRRPHPAAQLVAVADAFDYLTTARVALGSIRPDDIVPWIAERQETLFDPGWGRALCTLVVTSR